ncbi:hypothetical protein [Methanocalculus sp. MSAO_Arc2]|uniref:hypothetical protein n=1 Tax=Methanocalculus sp. MSAO_Arc2 TaxID=2293855 RepID=UPI002686D5F3
MILKPVETVTIAIGRLCVVNLRAGENTTIEIIASGIHLLRIPLSFSPDLSSIMAVG